MPILHSIATRLASFVASLTDTLNPNLIPSSIAVSSCVFRRADRDHTFPETAPIPILFSQVYCIVRRDERKRCMMGIVNDADNGASIIYRGVFGVKFRSANAVGHETSYD